MKLPQYLFITLGMLITSRLDNRNMHFCMELFLDNFQRTQNAAARVLSKTRKYDHITPTLKQLQWLPIRQGFNLKFFCLFENHLNRFAPSFKASFLTLTCLHGLSDNLTNFYFQFLKHYLHVVIEHLVHAHPNYGTLFL